LTHAKNCGKATDRAGFMRDSCRVDATSDPLKASILEKEM
jgi:hypothetical protein